ncbi:MAG: CocE/NonD family hydrolase [Saprospiraceae bacterium]
MALTSSLGSYYSFAQNSEYVKEHFTKIDTLIPMRDGIKLYTVAYIPKDSSQVYPILFERTPYSARPYGTQAYPYRLGPNSTLMKSGYIFVIQDVRGRYMSEGHNLEVTPFIDNKTGKSMVDESSDTYDSIDFLLKMLKNNNGRVGLYGISYPGFYATASLPEAHPAIKAVSPQAPVTDEFIGDDVNHHGAFFLLDNFNFINYFGVPRTKPVENYGGQLTDTSYTDSYRFFLEMGSLKNSQSTRLFNHKSYIWDEYLAHDTYDLYWQARNIRPHLKNIKIPTLVVGGWFDAEDCFGALRTYEALEKQNKGNSNYLVMGPWTHGAWSSGNWNSFGPYQFGSNTSAYFQDSLETLFFNYYLKDQGVLELPEARVFETGSNRWRSFASWPPESIKPINFYLNNGAKRGSLINVPVSTSKSYKSYISDPANPVPYTGTIQRNRNNQYMLEDQRFLSDRKDVISWTSEILTADMVLSGPVQAEIYASTSGTDMDLIVKVIDVYPDSIDIKSNGIQRLVRAEVFRGKFRESFTNPTPFKKNKPELISFKLPDIQHRFINGHRLMIQIQSSWFPLVDRNPNQFIHIPQAEAKDFTKAEIRIWADQKRPSKIVFGKLD